jgi:Kef-type K+ transport system membrane component KefB
LYIHPRFSASGAPFTSFGLFLGLAMSITAFPVLARILSDSNLSRTELGAIALTCAATGDVTAWCLLAFVSGVVQAGGVSIISVAALTLGFITFMVIAVRPFAIRAARTKGDRDPSPGTIAFTLTGMLIASATTEAIGNPRDFRRVSLWRPYSP